MNFNMTQAYPQPGPVGGRLIRKVIAFLKEQKVSLPIDSHILIAVSGGCDSVALAHLLIHYGRKITHPISVGLLHVNHRWRAQESDQDEKFVRSLGRKWGVPVYVRKLPPPKQRTGKSWEGEARKARKEFFMEEAKKHKARVLTAHQSEDVAETLLWRLFTGAAQTHGGGIAWSHGVELRPLLKIRKKELMAYLKEEEQSYVEDSTNFSERFLRARMRMRFMAEAEVLFPKMVEHLVSLALQAQNKDQEKTVSPRLDFDVIRDVLIQATELKLRRPHLKWIEDHRAKEGSFYSEVSLPEGWKLKYRKEKSLGKSRSLNDEHGHFPVEQWILEKY